MTYEVRTGSEMDELGLNFNRVDIENFAEELFVFLQGKSLLDPVITKKNDAVISKSLHVRYYDNKDIRSGMSIFSVLCVLPIQWEYAINPLLWSISLTETRLDCGTLSDIHEDWLIEESLIDSVTFKSIVLDFIEEYMKKTQGITNIYS